MENNELYEELINNIAKYVKAAIEDYYNDNELLEKKKIKRKKKNKKKSKTYNNMYGKGYGNVYGYGYLPMMPLGMGGHFGGPAPMHGGPGMAADPAPGGDFGGGCPGMGGGPGCEGPGGPM